jgi:hypothetical protein
VTAKGSDHTLVLLQNLSIYMSTELLPNYTVVHCQAACTAVSISCARAKSDDVPHLLRILRASKTTNNRSQHHSSLADFPFGHFDTCRWSKVVMEPVLTRPIRQADPWHADDLARQPAKSLTLLRSGRYDSAGTPHTTIAPHLPICPLPARQLSGRATVSISLRSQPGVVYIRCIGSRRPPLTQQRAPRASSTGLLIQLPSIWYQNSYATRNI